MRSNIRRRLPGGASALLACCLLAAAPAQAQPSAASLPESVTLDDLLEMTARSPRLRVEAALAEAYRGDVRAAGQHPNPVLSYNFAGFLAGGETNGGTQQQIVLSQPLLWPGQLDSRVEAARARLELARAEVGLLRAALALELRRAFVDLLAAEERASVLAEVEGAMERLAEIVRGRADAGAGRRWDVVRIDGELASIRSARDAADAERAAAAGRLGVLVGAPGWMPRAEGTWADLPRADVPGDVRQEHPVLEVARRAQRAARARLDSERALAVPPIELGVGTIVSTAPEGAYLYGAVAMPLPFFDANQGQIERAEREVEAAELAADAARIALDASLARARRVLDRRREALAAFERGVVDRLPLLSEMAQTAYQGGEISVFEVLDAVRAGRELRLERLEREQSLREAEIDVLEAALGAPIPGRAAP